MSQEGLSKSVESVDTLTADNSEQPPMEPEKVVGILKSALTELRETDDYITYGTLIDVYLNDQQSNYDTKSKIILLEGLFEVLELNPDIVYEIGWDLPGLMVDYINSDWDLIPRLKANRGIRAIFGIFELLLLHGNHKEIFLRCCEILTSLKPEDTDYENEVPIFGVAFHHKLIVHNIIELLFSCLSSIKTKYPSRFLSKLIISVIEFLNNNYVEVSSLRLFIFRRLYVICRQYDGMPLPEECKKMDPKELEKLVEDEDYLQRKLLNSFLTHFVWICIGPEPIHWTYRYYKLNIMPKNSSFQLPPVENVDDDQAGDHGLGSDTNDSGSKIADDENWMAMLLRCSHLAEAMDLDLEALFMQQFEDTESLFAKLDNKKPITVLNDEIYNLLISDFNARSKAQKTIPISETGITFLISQMVTQEKIYTERRRVIPVTLGGVIKWTLRVLIPTIVDHSLKTNSLVDSTIFWSWYLLTHDKNLKQELMELPHVFIHIYLQILTFYASKSPTPALRIVFNTLITRILTMLPELFSYDFIIETITTCPYENIKLAFVGILKDLFIRQRAGAAQSLNGALKQLDLKNNSKLPQLPPRDAPTYIQVTTERKKDLIDLLELQLLVFFGDGETDPTQLDQSPLSLSILLGILNLFIGIKLKLTKDEISSILTSVRSNVTSFKATTDNGLTPVVNVELLTLGVDSLSK